MSLFLGDWTQSRCTQERIRSYHSGDGQPIPVVEAMVRLGCKYGFVPLCQEATSRLKHEYPANLGAYTSDHTRIEMDDSIELLDLLKLAQEHNELHSILPGLYHEIHNSFDLVSIEFGTRMVLQLISRLSRNGYSLSQMPDLPQNKNLTWLLTFSNFETRRRGLLIDGYKNCHLQDVAPLTLPALRPAPRYISRCFLEASSHMAWMNGTLHG